MSCITYIFLIFDWLFFHYLVDCSRQKGKKAILRYSPKGHTHQSGLTHLLTAAFRLWLDILLDTWYVNVQTSPRRILTSTNLQFIQCCQLYPQVLVTLWVDSWLPWNLNLVYKAFSFTLHDLANHAIPSGATSDMAGSMLSTITVLTYLTQPVTTEQ